MEISVTKKDILKMLLKQLLSGNKVALKVAVTPTEVKVKRNIVVVAGNLMGVILDVEAVKPIMINLLRNVCPLLIKMQNGNLVMPNITKRLMEAQLS